MQLADLLDGGADGGGGRLDLTTGESWPKFTFDGAGLDVLADDEEDEGRWLDVESQGSRYVYQDMVDFAATRAGERLRRRLESALEGRGAFRQSRDGLFECPDDREEWLTFSEDRRSGRARAWLADAGYRAVTRTGRPLTRPAFLQGLVRGSWEPSNGRLNHSATAGTTAMSLERATMPITERVASTLSRS